jgi:DNA-binding MarR family transcriptional regulator
MASRRLDARPDLVPPSLAPDEIELRRQQAGAYIALSRIQRELEAKVAQLFTEHRLSEITPAQASALMVLFQERAPMTARQLAQRLGLTEVTVGRFIKALESAGWVSREPDPGDSRARLIRPTRKAYRALPRFIAVSNEMLDAAFRGFSTAEIRRVAETTERLRRNLLGDEQE